MNTRKIILLGFPKCGQAMFEQLIGGKRHESAWWPNAVEDYEDRFSEHRPIFIIRSPIERCWSEYWYFDVFNMKMSYKEYLTHIPKGVPFGGLDAIDRSDYAKYILRFTKYFPIVFSMEQLCQLNPWLPAVNANPNKPDMNQGDIIDTINLLNDRGIDMNQYTNIINTWKKVK